MELYNWAILARTHGMRAAPYLCLIIELRHDRGIQLELRPQVSGALREQLIFGLQDQRTETFSQLAAMMEFRVLWTSCL